MLGNNKNRIQPTPAQLFVYALIITLLVFVADNESALLTLTIINGIPGLIMGARKYPILTLLIIIGIWGTFLNALLITNTGDIVFELGPLAIREGAVHSTYMISLRFITLGGVSLIYVSSITPRDALRSLEEELRLPQGIAFSVAFALRLLKLGEHDIKEIMAMRKQRGARRIPLTPSDFESILMPLLSLMVERAKWVGIAAELRGFSLRKKKPFKFVPTWGLVVLILLLAVQFFEVLH